MTYAACTSNVVVWVGRWVGGSERLVELCIGCERWERVWGQVGEQGGRWWSEGAKVIGG